MSPPYRMRDLIAQTGLSRQAIHFYIQSGLLPEGEKTSKNAARYSEAHLERLLLIRRLQAEQFLPLKAIRALLEGELDPFSPSQRAFLRAIRDNLSPRAAPSVAPARPLSDWPTLPAEDREALQAMGLVRVRPREGGGEVLEEDAWVLDLWIALRAAGFTAALGFTPADLSLYEDSVRRLFQQELHLLTQRLRTVPADDAASRIEAALPLVHTFLTRYHAALVRRLLAAL